MTKFYSMIVLLILFIAVPCHTVYADKKVLVLYGHDDDEHTAGWENGRHWKTLDLQRKIDILIGINAGIYYMSNELLGSVGKKEERQVKEIMDAVIVPGFKFSEFVKEVDIFYSEVSDVRIPIPYAYLYVLKKLKGEKDTILYEYRIGLRKTWNNM